MGEITLQPMDVNDPNYDPSIFFDQNGEAYVYDGTTRSFVDSQANEFVWNESGKFVLVANKNSASPYPDTSNTSIEAMLKKNFPGAAPIVASQAKPNESWVETFMRTLPQLTLSAQQLALANLNYQRAKNGQPPLDMSQYSGVSASVGLSPDTQKLLMYGVGAIVVAMLLKGKK